MAGSINVGWRESLSQTKRFSYNFKAVSAVTSNIDQSISRIPFINRDSEFLFRFKGKTHQLSVTFAIYDDNTDVAGGSFTSPVITIPEQINYLENTIFSARFDAEFFLYLPRYNQFGYKGVLTNLKLPSKENSVNVMVADLTFIVGDVAGILGLLDDLIASLTGVDNN